ncbi:matrixin family metalloprotease [Aestuariicella hydrocarbonica]|uniref:Matrixin family metalloprotease n=1 Tax=Pseudomaricurvus hydrocarbonicus TaxID=1470433 RepID=A0A9E5MNI0_9GAMM|nr:matrixin family metalloprotease [Aestuariicella hydrocarbonica]NHO67463.1 matrixin family metalloprotease [Aestuariicella hydrocarbonica]
MDKPAPFKRTQLYYEIENFPNKTSFTHEQVRNIFSRAFAKWSAISPFEFKQGAINGRKADIVLRFGGVGSNKEDVAAEKKGTDITFSNNITWLDFHDLYKAKNWSLVAASAFTLLTLAARGIWELVDQLDKSRADLYSVAVHEIGHVLGLHHVGGKNSIMYENLDYDRQVNWHTKSLPQEDMQSLIKIYPKFFSEYFLKNNKINWFDRGGEHLKKISIGNDDSIWAVNEKGELGLFSSYHVTYQDDKTTWFFGTGIHNIKDISCISAMCVVLVNNANKILIYDHTKKEQHTIDVNFNVVKAAATGEVVWAITDNGKLAKIVVGESGSLDLSIDRFFLAEIVDIDASVTPEGMDTLVVLNKDGDAFRKVRTKDDDQNWRSDFIKPKGDIRFKAVSVGADGCLMGASNSGKVYRCIAGEKEWSEVATKNFSAIAMSKKDNLWGLDNGRAYSTIYVMPTNNVDAPGH